MSRKLTNVKATTKEQSSVLVGAKHAALRGIDMSKVDLLTDPVLPPEAMEVIAAGEMLEAGPQLIVSRYDQAKATVPGFTKTVEQWEILINEACAGDQKQRDKYGVIANALSHRLLHPTKVSSVAESYYTK